MGRIIDYLFSFPSAVPFDLYRKMDEVMGSYRKVLEGEITDTAEVERITKEFNGWHQEVCPYL
jgi:hypothetical protein